MGSGVAVWRTVAHRRGRLQLPRPVEAQDRLRLDHGLADGEGAGKVEASLAADNSRSARPGLAGDDAGRAKQAVVCCIAYLAGIGLAALHETEVRQRWLQIQSLEARCAWPQSTYLDQHCFLALFRS